MIQAARWRRMLAAGAFFALLAGAGCAPEAPAGPAERIRAVETGLRPELYIAGEPVPAMTLRDRMAHYAVPGVSVAVIRDGEIDWAQGYGVRTAGRDEPVTADTLFQAASISKPVAALGALRLVAAGRLGLDEPVNGRLVSWQVPDNELTAREPVTLRRLLTHSAGLTVHGFPGYAVTAPRPTVVQLLDGQPPANTAPVRVDILPGAQWRYSGGGYVVMQQLVADVTGQSFADYMQAAVLDPLGMTGSTYAQPLPPAGAARAATAHRADGQAVDGRWHVYPELAAAGLWTTAADLCRFALGVSAAAAGETEHILPADLARRMLEPGIGQWGLGPGIQGAGADRTFHHGGANEGFRCTLVCAADGRRGAAIMTNSDAGGPLMEEILRGIAHIYGWPDHQPQAVTVAAVAPEELAPCVGEYRLVGQPDMPIQVAVVEGRLHVRSAVTGDMALLPLGPSRFVSLEQGWVVTAVRDADGRVNELTAGRYGEDPYLRLTRQAE
ncbi:MAG: beta-lactamase family protein [Acidobacteria bacterium]|nr:beta-lactamase family protein [Acidobacteriota bacterium]